MHTENYENTDLEETAPAEASVEVPAEVPAEASVEVPAEVPVEVPSEVPSEVPAEAPAEVPAEASEDTRVALVREYELLSKKLAVAREEWVAAGRAAEQVARERLGADELEAAHEALWAKMYNLRVGELGEHAAAVEALRERLQEAREQLIAITLANSRAKASLAKSRLECYRAKLDAREWPKDENLTAKWKQLSASLAKEEKSRKDIRKMLKSTKINCENLAAEYRSMKSPPSHIRTATLIEKD